MVVGVQISLLWRFHQNRSRNTATRNNGSKLRYKICMIETVDKLLWTYQDTAKRLSLTVQALRDLVYKGRGPKVTRIGRRVMFRPNDVEEWILKLAEQS